tara:strand:- start:41 stop:1180 length:1140 start_codon:yes stop_codon:yes gene_type:complete
MNDKELKYYQPYSIEKEYNFREKLKNTDSFYDQMLGEYEYFYKDEGNYGNRRNSDKFTAKEYCENGYILDQFHNWRTWFKNGKNIFSFSQELLQMLEKTDVNDLTYKSFKLPYDNFYISLKSLGIKITENSEKIIEGVYVSIDRQAMENDYEEKDPLIFDYAISFNFVGDFLEHKLIDFDKIWDDSGYGGANFWNYAFYFREKENIITIENGIDDAKKMFRFSYFPENKEQIDNLHLDAFNRHIKFIDNTCKVLVNSLLYLSLPKESKDVIAKYPNDLPHNFNKKLTISKTEKEQIKIGKKISETGFSKINYVGLSFSKNNKSNTNSGLELSPHWRRGHWRNQAYGIQLKENKLIWIKPTIVNKNLGIPEKGHVYEIKN